MGIESDAPGVPGPGVLAQAGALQYLGFVTGVLCAIVLLWILFWFFVALWVHKDAPRHGMHPLLWFVVVLILGLVGLLLYFLARSLGHAATRQRRRARKRAKEEGRR